MLFFQTDVKSAAFPIELFQNEEIDVHFDLLDSNVYICSPTVLALFSDNFDIQEMNRMLAEIIESDIVDSTIYIQIANSEFSSRALNPYLYNVIFQKILNRWLYPIAPERRLRSCGDKICMLHNSVYKSSLAKVARGSCLSRNTFLAQSVSIGSNSTVENSNLEEAVSVGNQCSISGSIVMKNTRIGNSCKLTDCIVGENVEIPDNCEIKGKVVIGHNCVLKPGVVVPEDTRISCEKTEDEFSDDENEEGEAEEGEFGPKAFRFAEEEERESDDEDSQDDPANIWGQIYLAEEDDSDSSLEGEEINWRDDFSGEDEDMGEGEGGDQGEADEEEHHDVKNFKREVLESLQRAESEGKIVTDNLVLEINSSKHAWNTTLSEVNQCVLESVLTLNIDLTLPPPKLFAAVKGNLTKFKQLLVKYSKSKSGQDYYLVFLPELVKRYPTFLEIIAKVLHTLYEFDVLGEDSILKWAAKLQDTEMKTKISAFLDWLEEDDDESSEEDSDDDE